MSRGILVGANERQEWLLPWWWNHFIKHCGYPVCFADFGLSKTMKTWCKKKGALLPISINDLFIKDQSEIDARTRADWEKRYPDTFWDARRGWFKKPLACLQSPYALTAWIDLDCEIVAPLDPLFNTSGVALAKDQSAKTYDSRTVYNSGVIVFEQKHPLIVEWAKQALTQSGEFRGDQDLLSHIIAEQKWTVNELPQCYNWAVGYGKREDVVIYHWLGDAAKAVLRNQIALEGVFK